MQKDLFETPGLEQPTCRGNQEQRIVKWCAEDCQLLHGDCLQLMFDLSDNSVDMVCCDMPYGTTACKWDTVLPLDMLWHHYKRVVKDDGAIVLFAAQPFTSALIMAEPKMFKYDWIWQKPKGTGHLNAKRQPMRDKEDICVFYVKQPTYNPQMTSGKPFGKKTGKKQQSGVTGTHGEFRNINHGTRYPKQVLQFPVVERGVLHPTQKPIELVEYLISTYTNEKHTVLDNCMGSGTTGVACRNLNRKFIGIEKDKEYFDIATKRILSTSQDAM